VRPLFFVLWLMSLVPVPADTLLVKGAWSSASDSQTPVPEGGSVNNHLYVNEYFGLTYPLPASWTQKYQGPPPSDSGYYVLAQILPTDSNSGTSRGTLLIVAHDLFFTPMPAGSALELVNNARQHLGAGYQVEQPPTQVRIQGRAFVRFGYVAPATGLHWYVLATESRCHVVEFIYTSRDAPLIKKLARDFGNATFAAPADAAGVPLCLSDYATPANVLERVEPVLSEHRYNPIPVRVIIDKEGKVEHIHFLSAFPSEATAIKDALSHWRFKPYMSGGQPVEVETGIMFGRAPSRIEPRPQ
jgi:hypothetical protein